MSLFTLTKLEEGCSAARRFVYGLAAGSVIVLIGFLVRWLVGPTPTFEVFLILNISWWIIYFGGVILACLPLSRYRATFFASLGAATVAGGATLFNQVAAYRAGHIVRWWVVPLAFPVVALALLGGTFGVASFATWIRLRMFPVFPEGSCPKCGYSRVGLPTARCPECGYQPGESARESGV